jgi:hypothetical protein
LGAKQVLRKEKFHFSVNKQDFRKMEFCGNQV